MLRFSVILLFVLSIFSGLTAVKKSKMTLEAFLSVSDLIASLITPLGLFVGGLKKAPIDASVVEVPEIIGVCVEFNDIIIKTIFLILF